MEDSTSPVYTPVYLSASVTLSQQVRVTARHPSVIHQYLKPTSELINEKNGALMHTMEFVGDAVNKELHDVWTGTSYWGSI